MGNNLLIIKGMLPTLSVHPETSLTESWTTFGVGFGIVFLVLSLLVILFYAVPSIFNQITRYTLYRKYQQDRHMQHRERAERVKNQTAPLVMSAYDNAAIATALHLYFSELHDEESNVITIKRIERRYSPWSSKIYSVRHMN